MKIIVLGAGAWGTAVAMSAAQHPAGHAVTLWARDAAQAAQMQTQRHNARYLPGITLPPSLTLAHGDFAALWTGADLVIVATPMAALRGMLASPQYQAAERNRRFAETLREHARFEERSLFPAIEPYLDEPLVHW